MATATKAPAAPDAGANFLRSLAASNLQNPANAALPGGLHADPTYLSFLRGAGFSYQEAINLAAQQQAAAKGTYATQSQRLPEQLKEAQEGTDTGLLDRGAYNSGERLIRENRNVVTNQQQGQDLISARAAALAQAQATLQGSISQLARDQADAVGSLQDRVQQQNNQDRYISAVAGANSGGGGGGGSVSFDLGPAPGSPAPAAPASAPAASTPTSRAPAQGATPGGQPLQAAGQTINDYLASPSLLSYVGGLPADQQKQFVAFTQASNPGADLSPVLRYIAGNSTAAAGQQQSANQAGLRSGGNSKAF